MAFALENAPFHVTGVPAADKALSQFSDQLQKKILTKSLRKAAKIITAAAKSMAPAESGGLKRSIKPKAKKRSRKTAHIVGIRVLTNWQTYKAGFNPVGFVEFGTQYQPAKPFMRPAADSNRAQVINFFKQDVVEAIKAAAKKQPRLGRM